MKCEVVIAKPAALLCEAAGLWSLVGDGYLLTDGREGAL